MIDRISSVVPAASLDRVGGATGPAPVSPAGGTSSTGFADALEHTVGRVEDQTERATSALELLGSGQSVDLHGTMIELEKADIALRTMVSVRDRLIGAYEQILNMAI